MEDAAVTAAWPANDTSAERLWAEVRPRLMRIALAVGVRPDDVPDLVQETLIAAHAALPRFDAARGRLEAWVATILVRRAHNLARGRRRRERAIAAFVRSRPDPRPVVRDASAALEARLTLERLLEALTAEQREVVALYEIAEWSAEEVGGALGISPATVRSVARDARRRLAEEAERLRPGSEEGAS